MCVLSPSSVVMCSQERQRENARKHLCYFTFSNGGIYFAHVVEGHADFPLPTLNWLTWWKRCRPGLSGTKVASASRPPKKNCPMSPPCSACLGHEPWFPYLTHTKPLQLLPKTSQEDISSKSQSPSATSPGQASSHVSPLQGPPNGFVHLVVIWPIVLSSVNGSYTVPQTGLY